MFDREDIKFWFSECKYLLNLKRIKITGCFLSKEVRVDKISFFIAGRRIGDAQLSILRLDVYRKFPEYNEKNSGWLLEKDFDLQDSIDEIEVHLYLEGESHPLKGKKAIVRDSHYRVPDAESDKPVTMTIDGVQYGKGPIIPFGSGVTKSKPFACLVICRPFLPDKDTDNDEFHYYFVDGKALDKVSIASIVKNYSHTIIEKMIYESDVSFFDSLETICIPGDNFIQPNKNELSQPRLTFLVSSDTHAAFMTQIASHFKEVQYIIPKLSCKDDAAAEALGKRNIKFIELDYNARECKELKNFAPDFIFCGADWTSEFFAISRIAKKLSIPTITLQEGPQDWHMTLIQPIKNKRVLRILNHYRNADIFLSQGAVTLNHIRPKYFAVTGNPKIGKIVENPFPREPLVLINCNFTYIAAKPPYENNREMWLRDVISACEEVKIKYFISQHPRDDGKLEYPNVIESSASVINEQLLKSSIIISRFSSIPYEALARGREAIYYNPHREPMLTYTGDVYGAVKLASNKSELVNYLSQHKKHMFFDKEKAARYLSRHCGPMDGQAINRIIHLFQRFPNHSFNHGQFIERFKSHSFLFNENVDSLDRKLNIAVFSRNTASDYSGGRYCSLMLAEALSYAGHKVFYITQNLPIFYSNFGTIASHQNIEICLTIDFENNLPVYPIDVIFLVPGLDKSKNFYLNAIAYARKNRSHLVLLNFESPNWFNELSPVQRDYKLWESWALASKYCSLILSNAGEGRKYAEEYYREVPAGARFDHAYPSINTFVADKGLSKEINKEKRIIIFARFSLSAHKGSFNIPDIMCEAMRGYTFVIMVGLGTIPNDIDKEIHDKAKQLGIQIEYKFKLSDYEKFMEIRKARLLLFPSFFEGYGYPPIEALYLNAPCIAFDLPVLRETCKDNLIFVPRGDWSAFKAEINQVLKYNKTIETNKEIRKVAKFEEYAKKLNTIVTTLVERNLPKELPGFEYKKNFEQKDWLKKIDDKKEMESGDFIKVAARFLRNHFPYQRYEQMKNIYINYKIIKSSARRTILKFISVFTRKRKV